jgi:hypothetical protein
MPLRRWVIVALLAFGCRNAEPSPPPAVLAPEPPVTAAASAEPAPSRAGQPGEPRWQELVGRCVTAQGTVGGGAKTGALLDGGSWRIGLILDEPAAKRWWSLPAGSRIRVRAVVGERADRPVFVQKPGEPVTQGIPVPEGTDLDQARRRFVLEQVELGSVRPRGEVDKELEASLG